MKQAKRRQKLLTLSKLLLFAALLVITIGLLVFWQQLQSDKTASSPQNIQTTTEARPSTEKPSEDHFAQYTVAPDVPRYIFIDKISVKAIIKPLGVTTDNYLEAPANIHETGWYRESAKPGHAGAMVIDGHVGLDQTPGVFYQLHDLQAGGSITIERGDGAVFHYSVVKSVVYEANNVDMNAALRPIGDQPGLNLITCAGTFNPDTQTFDQRLVVYAQQL